MDTRHGFCDNRLDDDERLHGTSRDENVETYNPGGYIVYSQHFRPLFDRPCCPVAWLWTSKASSTPDAYDDFVVGPEDDPATMPKDDELASFADILPSFITGNRMPRCIVTGACTAASSSFQVGPLQLPVRWDDAAAAFRAVLHGPRP
ncbi:hypothetical protein PAPYR_470 [Paratrimastix pyriformis]|uniref:Uncharacterized protein n=1 Tax=Paratrimastix pyriformis TaxID=342808 RepID=A0ABQ8UVK6_9EUKA|nr:hypothetical protein PAPYR_470 [Paratrimastix pyriformis]